MKPFGRQAALAALSAMAAALLAGCESFRLFNEYEVVESAEVEDTPWPRLVDVPDAPPPGQFSAAVPDPVIGAVVEAELSDRATGAGAALDTARAPVLSDTEREALAERDRVRQRRAQRPVLSVEERRELARREAARRARLERARAPVLTPEDRERLRVP